MPKGIYERKIRKLICKRGHSDWYFKGDKRRCRSCDRLYVLNAWNENRDRYNKMALIRLHALRVEVLNRYGGRCACCGESQYEFLSIDHINNDGAEHRREVGRGASICRWLKKNNYPAGFQVLCMNCNCAKGWYGMCPHQTRLEKVG
jgi:hypothetical protein